MRCKFFLSGVLFLLASFSLHAAENCHCGLDSQSTFIYIADNAKIYKAEDTKIYKAEDAKIYIDGDTKIYIAEDTKIYDNDFLFPKPTCSNKINKKQAGIDNVAPAPAESKITENEPATAILIAFPFTPSSSSFINSMRESATVSLQPKYDRQQPAAKTCRENTYRRINNADLSLYHLKQRQKLSIAATQCGMLTSFASTSPPAIKSLSLRA